MFFIFSKILGFLINPIIWILTLLVISYFSKKAKKWILATMFTILFFGNSFIIDELLRIWEWPTIQREQIKNSETAIVLGGGMATWDASFKRINFVKSTDRFLQAVDLYKKGIVKNIIISGGNASLFENYGIESKLIEEYMILLGIPDSCIISEIESQNTYQNAYFTAQLIKKNNIQGEFILITSGSHMRRSIACFDKQRIKVIPYSTDRISGVRKYNPDHLLLPKLDNFQNWYTLLHEWIGYVMYKINGYI